MDLRRRRRRTLLDEREGTETTTRRRRRAAPKAYAEAALDDNQARVTDLIPRWHLTLWGLFLVGLLCSAGWVALDHFAPQWSEALQLPLAPLSLSSTGGIASWWLASLYFIAALKSLLIYQVRRYRNDDYGGSYRLWIWATVTFFFASVDAACNLRHVAAQLITHFAQTPLFGDGAIWGDIVGAAVFAPLAIRLVFELAACRTALVAFVLSSLAFLTAALAMLPIHPWSNDLYTAVVSASIVLAAQQFLLLSLGYYARHVYLDSQGEIEHVEEEAAAVPAQESQSDSEEDEAEEEAPPAKATGTVTPPTIRASDLATSNSNSGASTPRNDSLSRLVSAHSSSRNASDDDDAEDEGATDSSGRKLSKAERKRLRRQGKAA